MGPGETEYGLQRRNCSVRTASCKGGRKKSVPKGRLSGPNRRDDEQFTWRPCRRMGMLKNLTAKRQSAEQLEKEQAKRLSTQRTEDGH